MRNKQPPPPPPTSRDGKTPDRSGCLRAAKYNLRSRERAAPPPPFGWNQFVLVAKNSIARRTDSIGRRALAGRECLPSGRAGGRTAGRRWRVAKPTRPTPRATLSTPDGLAGSSASTPARAADESARFECSLNDHDRLRSSLALSSRRGGGVFAHAEHTNAELPCTSQTTERRRRRR
jgi:hypothetical protein